MCKWTNWTMYPHMLCCHPALLLKIEGEMQDLFLGDTALALRPTGFANISTLVHSFIIPFGNLIQQLLPYYFAYFIMEIESPGHIAGIGRYVFEDDDRSAGGRVIQQGSDIPVKIAIVAYFF